MTDSTEAVPDMFHTLGEVAAAIDTVMDWPYGVQRLVLEEAPANVTNLGTVRGEPETLATSWLVACALFARPGERPIVTAKRLAEYVSTIVAVGHQFPTLADVQQERNRTWPKAVPSGE